jgi:hypothetical protein
VFQTELDAMGARRPFVEGGLQRVALGLGETGER